MTRVPPQVDIQVRAAILDTFKRDEFWSEVAFSTGEDLHDRIAHRNFTEEVTELLQLLRVRGTTLEFLEHLRNGRPESAPLQAATDAYKEAKQKAEEAAAREPQIAPAFAERQASFVSETPPLAPVAASAPGKQGFQMRPWMWMLVGALALMVVSVILFSAEEDPFTFGDDAALDSLWNGCEQGDLAACDDLFEDSPEESEYEDVGFTCGGLVPAGASGNCVAAALADLAAACSEGFNAECDALYELSPAGSVDEAFGSTCAGLVPEGTFGQCEVLLGPVSN